jgi:adenosylhomocysteinase
MVPNTVSFVPALNDLASVSAILVKPKTKTRDEYQILNREGFRLLDLDRSWAASPVEVNKTLIDLGLTQKNIVILDIGGYFAGSIDEVAKLFDGQILGVMEGTENGLRRYEANPPTSVPVITVARSPLKLPEDYLVGASVVFSIEATLREQAEILQTRTATVVGYGRVGSAIADILRNRGIGTVVYDNDPIKLAAAAARGFKCFKRLNEALSCSSLIVCATGNKALDLKGFALLPDRAVVASVTSADDEFALDELAGSYTPNVLSPRLTRYGENRGGKIVRSFDLIAGGNAANFLHGAVIGPAMQLIEGEKLAAVSAIVKGLPKGHISELSDVDRRSVAEIWNHHFL